MRHSLPQNDNFRDLLYSRTKTCKLKRLNLPAVFENFLFSTLRSHLRLELTKTHNEYSKLGSLLFVGVGIIALTALLLIPSFEHKALVYSYTAYCFFVYFYNTFKDGGLPLGVAILHIPLGLLMIVSLQWFMPTDMVHLTTFLFPLVFVFVFEFHTRLFIFIMLFVAVSVTWLIGWYRDISYLESYLITTFGATLLVGLVVRKSAERTEILAHYDGLTGLMNRFYWEQNLNYLLNLSQRQKDDLTLVFIDLDNFKEINDSFGHAAGDELLRKVADTIKKEIRATDLAARWGGDEFAIIMPDTSANEADKLLDRVRAYLLNSEFSAGIVTAAADEPMADLLRRADKNMYQIKHAKKAADDQKTA